MRIVRGAPAVIITLFPYSVAFILYCIFSGFLMESVFMNSAFVCLAALFLFWIAGLICAVSVCVSGILRKRDAFGMIRTVMLIKVISIPAYIVIFIVGTLCMLTIFTFGISIFLMLFDAMSIFLSGTVGVAAVKRAHDEKVISVGEAVLHGILQFLFCADVVSSLILFCKAKRVRAALK